MSTIILDFTGIRSMWSLHEYLKETFFLSDYYGRNMDALWDCLHCAFEEPTTIVLKNIAALPSGMKEASDILLELFRDLKKEDQEVSLEIEWPVAPDC